MARAKTIDRLEWTRKNSRFLQESQKIKAEEGIKDTPEEEKCPECGGELTRWEGCYRCKKCGWSKC